MLPYVSFNLSRQCLRRYRILQVRLSCSRPFFSSAFLLCYNFFLPLRCFDFHLSLYVSLIRVCLAGLLFPGYRWYALLSLCLVFYAISLTLVSSFLSFSFLLHTSLIYRGSLLTMCLHVCVALRPISAALICVYYAVLRYFSALCVECRLRWVHATLVECAASQ
jgi:hypothetical protein